MLCILFFRLDHYSKLCDLQTAAVITCILGQPVLKRNMLSKISNSSSNPFQSNPSETPTFERVNSTLTTVWLDFLGGWSLERISMWASLQRIVTVSCWIGLEENRWGIKDDSIENNPVCRIYQARSFLVATTALIVNLKTFPVRVAMSTICRLWNFLLRLFQWLILRMVIFLSCAIFRDPKQQRLVRNTYLYRWYGNGLEKIFKRKVDT